MYMTCFAGIIGLKHLPHTGIISTSFVPLCYGGKSRTHRALLGAMPRLSNKHAGPGSTEYDLIASLLLLLHVCTLFPYFTLCSLTTSIVRR